MRDVEDAWGWLDYADAGEACGVDEGFRIAAHQSKPKRCALLLSQ
jgi:hypothetical protein